MIEGNIRARAFTLVDEFDNDAVTFSLSGSTQHKNRRLHIGFVGDTQAEIEIEPGPDVKPKGNIITQIMLWGPTTKDGTKRNRFTMSITADGAGGLAGVLDSSTNDPSGSEGQAHSMPLVLNAGEAKGMYVVFHPSDNSITLTTPEKLVRVYLNDIIEAAP
jgi:hypothetical protein